MANGKTQLVRVADVTLLGPFTIWAGVRARDLPMWARIGLILYGVATIGFNGLNLVAVEEKRARQVRLK